MASWGSERGHDWSARWTGFLVPVGTGTFALAIESNELAILRLAGKTVAQVTEAAPRAEVTVKLTTDQALPMEVDFIKPRRETEPANHSSFLHILWRVAANGAWQPVPDTWLQHSRAQQYAAELSLR
jgi:hypothetical protein